MPEQNIPPVISCPTNSYLFDLLTSISPGPLPSKGIACTQFTQILFHLSERQCWAENLVCSGFCCNATVGLLTQQNEPEGLHSRGDRSVLQLQKRLTKTSGLKKGCALHVEKLSDQQRVTRMDSVLQHFSDIVVIEHILVEMVLVF